MVHYGYDLTYLDVNILYVKARQMPPFPHVYFVLHLSLFIYIFPIHPFFLLLFPNNASCLNLIFHREAIDDAWKGKWYNLV